jgi:hypothetical protein
VLLKLESLLAELTEPTKTRRLSAAAVKPALLAPPFSAAAELPPAKTMIAPFPAA